MKGWRREARNSSEKAESQGTGPIRDSATVPSRVLQRQHGAARGWERRRLPVSSGGFMVWERRSFSGVCPWRSQQVCQQPPWWARAAHSRDWGQAAGERQEERWKDSQQLWAPRGPGRAEVQAAGPGLPVLTPAAEQPRGRQDPVSWRLMRKFRLAVKTQRKYQVWAQFEDGT